jgi:predicted O-methyltransferase YrrM
MGVRRTLLGYLPTPTNRLCRAAGRFVGDALTGQDLERIEAVPGWLKREQGSLLCYLAAHARAPGCVVEIGSFMGRSTLWLARGVRHAAPARIVAIDPHDGHERPEVRSDLDSFATFLQTLQAAGAADVVTPVRRRSQEVAPDWSEPIRLLWIDGSHDYPDVLADLEGFAPHVSPGGYVALHDTRGRRYPGVRRAMLEFFGRHPEFRRVAALRNMTVFQRRAAAQPAGDPVGRGA